jgi:L-histidine N-alpha-methyltransferase
MLTERCRLDVHSGDARFLARFAEDVRRGLGARPRSLPPKYFYDEVGCRLFERITELPEYYLTRVEEGLVREVAGNLARRLHPRDLVELGPGSCRKVRWLLEALDHAGPIRYVAVDVGRDALARAATALAEDYPSVHVHAVVGDFERHVACLPPPTDRRLALFFGSTIGNFHPPARAALLGELRRLLGADGRLLLGVDLVKDRRVLEAAYDDAAGVTREFNRNILRAVNRAVAGDFQPDRFRHVAFYDAEASRIEMHLVPVGRQRVHLRRLGLVLDLDESDDIWTESSYKFTRLSTEAMLHEAGLTAEDWHTDAEDRFALVLARPTGNR